METIEFAIGDSLLGLVLVAKSDRGLIAILISDDEEELKTELQRRFGKALLIESKQREFLSKVITLIKNPSGHLELPLDIRGTELQKLVWQALCEIPAGETLSYTEVAKKIGRPKAVRAVANACAANALAIVIPCHRVLRSDGSLSGYYWGVERKKWLLEREKLK